MALPPESDEPTRRLPPTRPIEPLPEREVVREVDPAWTQAILDRLRSLRTAVVLFALLSLAALGVGIYALLTQEEENDARRGASQQRVQDLEDRVDELGSQTEEAASQDAVGRLRDQQRDIEKRLSAVEDAPDDSVVEDLRSDIRQLSDAVEQNGQAIEQLDDRVSDLEQQQSRDSASP